MHSDRVKRLVLQIPDPRSIVPADLEMDVAEALQALSPDMRQLASLLASGQTVTQVAQILQLRKPEVQRRIETLRRTFEHLGLQDYL